MPLLTRRAFTRLVSALPLARLYASGKARGAASKVAGSPKVEDFAFLHLSDTHLDPRPSGQAYNPAGRSVEALRWFADRSRLGVLPDGRLDEQPAEGARGGTALPAAFAIHTGDVFEYSVIDACWQDWERAVEGAACEVHLVPGNHDNTWASINHRLRERYGGDSHSFDHRGCHFVCLNSAGALDPLPCWDERTLRWLRRDLRGVSPETPVILALHHPLSGNAGYASEHDKLRFWEVIRKHNVVLMLDGHWHTVHARTWQNIPRVNGGETFRLHTGYSSVRVSGGVLHQRYHYHEEAEGGARETRVLSLRIDQPAPRFNAEVQHRLAEGQEARLVLQGRLRQQRVQGRSPAVSAWINERSAQAQNAAVTADDQGLRYDVGLEAVDLPPGRHYATIRMETDQRITLDSEVGAEPSPVANEQAVEFELPDPAGRLSAKAYRNAAGIKSPLTLVETDGASLLVFGDTAGWVRALDAETLEPSWGYSTRSEVLHAVSLCDGVICVGDGDGRVHLLQAATGEPVAKLEGFPPVYAPAANLGRTFYLGDANGGVHAISTDGQRAWSRDVAEFAIEAAPAVDKVRDQLIFGAWDGFFYALDRQSGRVKWRSWNAYGSTHPKSRYYGPGDCTPVVVGPELWGTDRGYTLGRFRLNDGKLLAVVQEQVSAVSPAGLGGGVVARGLDDVLTRYDERGEVVWRAEGVPLGRSPQPAVYAATGGDAGLLGVVSDLGLLTLLNDATGEVLASYSLSPSLFVQAPLTANANGNTWYSAGMDGVVTKLTVS